MKGKTISLDAPKPICGSLIVETIPDYAELYIDGKKVGETPMFVSELLIGKHEVKISKANYADYTETVTIAKGDTKTVNATLSSTVLVLITTNVSSASFSIDGQSYEKFGSSKQRNVELSYGTHHIIATAEGYADYTSSFTVSPDNTACTISMKEKFGPLTFTVNGVTFEMLPVEGGTFTMGATAEQNSDADDDEKPSHNVTLSSYYMGKYEVTQKLWRAVMGNNPSHFTGDSQRPVECVSWNDCQTFITKLNQLLAGQLGGKRFVLPTEAQWEYAARGGKKSKGYKYSGSNTLGNVAWYTNNSGRTTHAVGTKQPNELGLYDMSGNVYEWCSDWYGSYSNSAQTDPTGPATGSYRVCRDGSWSNSARFCRVSNRLNRTPDYTHFILGLRLSLR